MAMETPKKEKKNSHFLSKMDPRKREALEWVLVIVVSFLFALFIDSVLIVNAMVPSASMEPTVMTGDRLFGNRLAYLNSDIERGDIVIFKFPDNEDELFIKRVIGMPGETIEMVDGKIYIDGSPSPLYEPYITVELMGNYGPVTVPQGAYFMLGDNRNISADSRYWKQPFVYKKKILGKAMLQYWPHISLIK